jgi:hypothetical protein
MLKERELERQKREKDFNKRMVEKRASLEPGMAIVAKF